MKSNKCPWCSVYANSVKGIIDILYHRIKIYSQIQEMLFPNQQSWAHLLCSFGVVSMSCNNELWQLWHPNHPQIKLEPSFKRQKRRILAMSKPIILFFHANIDPSPKEYQYAVYPYTNPRHCGTKHISKSKC